jgi:hypothetical protein
MRLVIIEESFAERLPRWLGQREIKRFEAKLQKGEKITVVEYRVIAVEARKLVPIVCERLLPSRYYAHIAEKDRLLVMFHGCAFCLRRGDQRTIDLCRSVGNEIGIPNEELQFETMFDQDHPDLFHE